jgi:hypothetical protein
VRRVLLDWIEKVARLEPAAFHMKHAAALNINLEHPDWEMNEANWAYTSHELAAVHSGSTAEALAALGLPLRRRAPPRRPAARQSHLCGLDRFLRLGAG